MRALAPTPADALARYALRMAARRYALAVFAEDTSIEVRSQLEEALDRAAERFTEAVLDMKTAKRAKRRTS